MSATAKRISGARIEQIEGAGHSPYFEQSETWNSLVGGFWANVS